MKLILIEKLFNHDARTINRNSLLLCLKYKDSNDTMLTFTLNNKNSLGRIKEYISNGRIDYIIDFYLYKNLIMKLRSLRDDFTWNIDIDKLKTNSRSISFIY